MMFSTMLPVANVLAVLVAVDIADAICSASASSICLGSSITRLFPAFISKSVSGSEKNRSSKVILISSGSEGFLDTADGFWYLSYSSISVLVASTTST